MLGKKLLGWASIILGILLVMYPVGIALQVIGRAMQGLEPPALSVGAIVANGVIGAGLIWLGLSVLRAARSADEPPRPDIPS